MGLFGPLKRTSILGDLRSTAAEGEQGEMRFLPEKMPTVSCSEDSRIKQLVVPTGTLWVGVSFLNKREFGEGNAVWLSPRSRRGNLEPWPLKN